MPLSAALGLMTHAPNHRFQGSRTPQPGSAYVRTLETYRLRPSCPSVKSPTKHFESSPNQRTADNQAVNVLWEWVEQVPTSSNYSDSMRLLNIEPYYPVPYTWTVCYGEEPRISNVTVHTQPLISKRMSLRHCTCLALVNVIRGFCMGENTPPHIRAPGEM